MARGGRRDGAGRPKGTKEEDYSGPEIADLQKLTPLEFFKAVLRDEAAPFSTRYKAAQDAAPFIHSRLAPKADDEDQGTLDDGWGTLLSPKAQERKQGMH